MNEQQATDKLSNELFAYLRHQSTGPKMATEAVCQALAGIIKTGGQAKTPEGQRLLVMNAALMILSFLNQDLKRVELEASLAQAFDRLAAHAQKAAEEAKAVDDT